MVIKAQHDYAATYANMDTAELVELIKCDMLEDDARIAAECELYKRGLAIPAIDVKAYEKKTFFKPSMLQLIILMPFVWLACSLFGKALSNAVIGFIRVLIN